MTASLDFLVQKDDLRECSIVTGPPEAAITLEPGQVLLRVDTFAFTANNITYGAVGDLLGYWRFFPASGGWGRIPVWGFADVVRSRHEGMREGERVYGYLPMSTHLVVTPGALTAASFVDVAAHRADLPPIYNQYVRLEPGAARDRHQDALVALFRPLFTTAFLLDDFLTESRFFGAGAVVLSSASSKTALGLAFLLAEAAAPRRRVIGLTSPANAAFTRDVGFYDEVCMYEDVASLASDRPTVFVDFAGNASHVRAVHETLGARLAYSCQVGMTHWEARAPQPSLPGPAPILFFAPEHARQRLEAWGPAQFQSRVTAALQRFLVTASHWLRVVESRGPVEVERVYRAVLEGTASPTEGHVLSLHV